MGLTPICACCLAGFLWWDGYYLPNKPCRPIAYPAGNLEGIGTGRRFAYITSDSVDLVLAFYDTELKSHTGTDYADTGEWYRSRKENGTYLYRCYGVDINGLTTETGCIYVAPSVSGALIEGWLLRSEGGHVQCQ
jgi:hypothetical protein